ncbi:Glutathione gamma-glutamylcysteinyltransferase [Bertholletia excelsa]
MALAGIYRRVLPSPPAVEFASPQGKQLFVEALDGGNMEGFFKLISYYQTQSEPAYCGLASLAMVLNALAIDPGRTWKGPWRWFDDSMLDCCEPLSKVKEKGISFGKLACLAHCNGAKVDAFRTNESTIDDFRRSLVSCTASQDCHMIISYHRAKLKQTGTGHFSPIGGYHAGRDMVLILDVARFKYPPHWVPLSLLWEAMDSIDDATGHYRGFMIVSKLQKSPSILYTVSCRNENWNSIVKYLIRDVPPLLKSEDIKDIEGVLSGVISSIPSNFNVFIMWIVEVRRKEEEVSILSEEERKRLELKEAVLKQVRETKLFAHVTGWLASEMSCCKEIVSLSEKNALPEIAANVCCQGAELLAGRYASSDVICCREANMKLLEDNGQRPVNMVSGMVITNGGEEKIDVLVPFSQRNPGCITGAEVSGCSERHPSNADVLTILLLALPLDTWSGIRNNKLQEEMVGLMLTENLPPLLQEEVLHLQRQLHFLATDLGAISP